MAQHTMEHEPKKAGPFQWIVVIIIPLIFALTLAIIILSFMGVNVIGKTKEFANHIPFLSNVVTTEEEKVEENKIELLENDIRTKDAEIDQLTAEVVTKDAEIDELNQEVTKITNQLKELETGKQEKADALSEVTTAFKGMEPEAAAPIISNLDTEMAASIVKSLPTKEKAALLGALDPELAASITNLLLE
ncbi:hypothetical protein NC661_16020 [Aquibacillus koreensis]|uniref:Magnesium transporter MgtE intracellular domain-containing protein n=1 Tax=Aquibacillus koreensis TaxID=279446 RepID=A0A9X4AJ59_9BACI|nr:hypothetical protein [Aquibacillus koreensis]MCT2534524.1 hypothetical protein [Aquibacillus koreensis]MDC3421882.1 hypothetical protein [Aquibacillus koreensis]